MTGRHTTLALDTASVTYMLCYSVYSEISLLNPIPLKLVSDPARVPHLPQPSLNLASPQHMVDMTWLSKVRSLHLNFV